MITKIKTLINATNTEIATHNFVKTLGEMVIQLIELETKLNDTYFSSKSVEELKILNTELYHELLSSNYETSYANPTYCVHNFGKDLGQLITAIYSDYRKMISFAYRHNQAALTLYGDAFLEFAVILSQESEPTISLTKSYKTFKENNLYVELIKGLHNQSSPKDSFAHQLMTSEDVSDTRYLFKYGSYITDNELKTAEFLNSYDDVELKELMDMTARAYVRGFETDGKDITLRHNVQIRYNVGQEKMIHVLIESFKNHNLNGFFGNPITTPANKQYDYDHRFDNGIYLDQDYLELDIKTFGKVLEDTKDISLDYSGIMYFDKFGEAPFTPESKDENISLSEEQTKLSAELRNKTRTMREEYFKGSETSFCIIAFPVPEIGEQFEEIYAATCRINKLSSEEYLPIQQAIIDTLDQADYVHIKGNNKNKTDIIVKQGYLEDPDTQSNYYNCGADVNIPVGEVFTSPVLKGTQGLLHLDVVFLDELKYIDLELTFTDGYITDYTCKNFDDESKNRKYIEENLLFPHKTLPLGEFAIGTNTLAYVIAEKYNIVDILPILIVEKMGPHFAIGDTCYTYAEDIDVFNPDGKCIISRDNEKSILRKENPSEAYTNVHTDITLPYDSLAFIDAITSTDERLSIIKDGRFVLPGTEKLNEPFN
ncbi:MAG: aminopeptidase [Clostridiales bacterium]|nr:aminopeptidase [Clostridiales bacterium]